MEQDTRVRLRIIHGMLGVGWYNTYPINAAERKAAARSR